VRNLSREKKGEKKRKAGREEVRKASLRSHRKGMPVVVTHEGKKRLKSLASKREKGQYLFQSDSGNGATGREREYFTTTKPKGALSKAG